MRVLAVFLVLCSSTFSADDFVNHSTGTSNNTFTLVSWGNPGLKDAAASTDDPVDTVTSGDINFVTWPHFARLTGTIAAAYAHPGGEYRSGCVYRGTGLTGANPNNEGVVWMDAVATQEDTIEANATGIARGQLKINVSLSHGGEKIHDGFWVQSAATVDGSGVAWLSFSYDKTRGQWWMQRIDPYNGYLQGWTTGKSINSYTVDWSTTVDDGDDVVTDCEIDGTHQFESTGTPTVSELDILSQSVVEEDIQ